jgi:hypothetical protein
MGNKTTKKELPIKNDQPEQKQRSSKPVSLYG